MGSKERRERERDAVRTKILDAARELFVAHGYGGVSMRAIADKIEYSPTVVYKHFEDKEALITGTLVSELDGAFGSNWTQMWIQIYRGKSLCSSKIFPSTLSLRQPDLCDLPSDRQSQLL